MLRTKSKVRWYIFIFLLPALLLYTSFMVLPLFNSMRMSFYTGTLLNVEKFVGFANYIKIFTQSPFNERLFGAFLNNIEFFLIVVIIQTTFGLILALVLTRNFRGVRFFRVLYVLPATLSLVIVGFLFNLILNPTWGIVDEVLEFLRLGFLIRPWLGDPLTTLPVISFVTAWQFMGISMIFFIAGIEGIDTEILEAAKIDGVNELGSIRYIKLPLIQPVLKIVIILTFIGNFTAFEIIYAMATTLGNPSYSADIFGTLFYRTTFGSMAFNMDLGLGATIATIMFFTVLIGVVFILYIFKNKESEIV